MSGELAIANRQREIPVNTGYLRRLVRVVLRDLLEIDHFDIAIHIVRAPEMTGLNETFLRHKGSTDVITFDYANEFRVSSFEFRVGPAVQKSETRNSKLETGLHGEIFVCIDEAVSQARVFRTTWQGELTRYVIHGLLHLCGFDDGKPAARREMKREENRLLKKIAARFPLSKLARASKLVR